MNKIITALVGILIVSVSLFAAFNAWVGIVSGVWLLFVGEWKLVLFGAVLSACAPLLLSILFMPGLFLIGIASKTLDKGMNVIGYPLIFVSFMIFQLIIVLWLTSILYFGSLFALAGHSWLILIFSYVVATAPLAYFARKERTNEALLVASSASITYLIAIILILVFNDVIWGIKHIGGIQFGIWASMTVIQLLSYFTNKK